MIVKTKLERRLAAAVPGCTRHFLVALSLAMVSFFPLVASGQTTVDGSLNVTTSIEVACAVPSPSGNLTFPFSVGRSLTNQNRSFEVTITTECTGGGTVSELRFDDGQHAVEQAGALTRRMANANQAGSFLAYRIFRGTTANRVGTSEVDCAVEPTGCNAISFSPAASSMSQVISGVIHDQAYSDQFAVPGGIYNDTVTLTIVYGETGV